MATNTCIQITEAIEAVAQERRRLTEALRQLEPFDGRYVSRLNESDTATVRSISSPVEGDESTHLMWRWVVPATFNGKAPRIDLTGLRGEIERLDLMRENLDRFAELDSIGAYLDALARLTDLRLTIEAEAKSKDIAYSDPCFFLLMSSISATHSIISLEKGGAA